MELIGLHPCQHSTSRPGELHPPDLAIYIVVSPPEATASIAAKGAVAADSDLMLVPSQQVGAKPLDGRPCCWYGTLNERQAHTLADFYRRLLLCFVLLCFVSDLDRLFRHS
jgi:hypothetical protein